MKSCPRVNRRSMRKINTATMAEVTWSSPKGKYGGASKEISDALDYYDGEE